MEASQEARKRARAALRVLEFLDRVPSTVSRVAREIEQPAQSVAEILDVLSARDLVRVRPSGSTGRYTDDIIYVTGDGHQYLADVKHGRRRFGSRTSWAQQQWFDPVSVTAPDYEDAAHGLEQLDVDLDGLFEEEPDADTPPPERG